MWSIVAHAGPSDEANGVAVKNLAPATFWYFDHSAWMPTPFGATVTALKPRLATASNASVICESLRFCAIPHDEKAFIKYVPPNWSTTLRPETLVGHSCCETGGSDNVVELVGVAGADVELVVVELVDVAGALVVELVVAVVDELVVDVELVDLGGTLVVDVVAVVDGLVTDVGGAAEVATGGTSTVTGGGGAGSGSHAGAHCTISTGAARIVRRPGCLFICSLTFCPPPPQLGRARREDSSTGLDGHPDGFRHMSARCCALDLSEHDRGRSEVSVRPVPREPSRRR